MPDTTSPGYFSASVSAAFSATPGFAPNRYTLPPFSANRAITPQAKSMPGTFSFIGRPSMAAPFTMPTPSGSTSAASASADFSAAFSFASMTISGFGVTT